MDGRSAEPVRWRLFIIFVVICVVLLLLGTTGRLSTIAGYLETPFAFIQSWVSGRINSVQSTISTPRDVATLLAENQQLRDRVAELERQNEELLEVSAEYTLLSTLLEYARDNPEYQRIAADIIGWDTSNFVHSFIINKGEKEGVRSGMPVETERGLVGRIVEVAPHSSQVQLLSDPGSAVNARLGTSRADGVVEGHLNDPIKIKWIDQDFLIHENELVMTSGLGGNFPPDLIIGRVVNVQESASQLFQEAEVRPAVDLERLEIVLVITNYEPISLFEEGDE